MSDSSRNRGEGTEHNVTPHQDLRTPAAWSQERAAAGTSRRPSAPVRAQFGGGFRPSGVPPQRAGIPADTATSEEAEQAVGIPRLITVIGKPLPFFSQDQELRSSAENRRHGSFLPCCQSSLTRPATISLSCRRQQLQKARAPRVGSDQTSHRAALAGTLVFAVFGKSSAQCPPRMSSRSSCRRCCQPVGFQNSATGADLGFYAARSYSLMRPPRTGRRLIRSWERPGTGSCEPPASRWAGRRWLVIRNKVLLLAAIRPWCDQRGPSSLRFVE